jgi:hypothetical protein
MVGKDWSKLKMKSRSARFFIPGAFLLLALLGISIWALSFSAPRRAINSQRFYQFPLSSSLRPGLLLRIAPLTNGVGNAVVLADASAYRILYTSESSTGKTVLSGGMLFVPRTRAPLAARPLVAWAHPTRAPSNVAPSSSLDPLNGMQPWLDMMIGYGWDVVATDYAGLGTPGRQEYLNGVSESRDLLYSVEAARSYRAARASANWVAWGHSYGVSLVGSL